MISKKIKTQLTSKKLDESNVDALAKGILAGDRKSVSRGITLVESKLKQDRLASSQLFVKLGKYEKDAKCIAITGPPGAGKSSFIESMGKRAIQAGFLVAVLSIDPTSELTGGSILADKTRMPELSSDPRAFVRPSPSGGDLGGVNRRTWEVKNICQAAGYDLIFIETVGVGQSESEASHLVDMVTVLLQPGSGDDLQSIKKGLNELADFFVVNKADGSQMDLAREAKSFMLAASKLSRRSGIKDFISLHSQYDDELADACWNKLMHRYNELADQKIIKDRRATQNEFWFRKKSEWAFMDWIKDEKGFQNDISTYFDQLKSGKLNMNEAVQKFLGEIQKKIKL